MYEEMTIAQLEELLQTVEAQRDTLKSQAREITAVLDKKRAVEGVQKKLAGMSEAERAALREALSET